MLDSRFKETVIVMLYHNSNQGAAGLVINKPMKKMSFSKLFISNNLIPSQNVINKEITLHWGGPVKSENILIDHCIAIGASDAGIYVGQSKNIIVRNSEAFHNVAGIEIENSFYADVYNNYTHDNTGGILVFDLPDLLIKKGGNVRVFNNLVIALSFILSGCQIIKILYPS